MESDYWEVLQRVLRGEVAQMNMPGREVKRFSEMIVSPTYCVDRHGHTLYRGDERAQLRWGDARG